MLTSRYHAFMNSSAPWRRPVPRCPSKRQAIPTPPPASRQSGWESGGSAHPAKALPIPAPWHTKTGGAVGAPAQGTTKRPGTVCPTFGAGPVQYPRPPTSAACAPPRSPGCWRRCGPGSTLLRRKLENKKPTSRNSLQPTNQVRKKMYLQAGPQSPHSPPSGTAPCRTSLSAGTRTRP